MDTTRATRPVLVGIDGSEASRCAVEWAAREAARRHAPLTIIHVCEPLEYRDPHSAPQPGSFDEAIESQGRAWLEEARTVATAVDPGIDPQTELVWARIAETLIVRSTLAQLVVVGSRGSGGFTELLLGSTAVDLSAHSRCPVAVIRSPAPDPAAPVLVGVDGPHSGAAVEFAFEAAAGLGVPLVALHTWTHRALTAAWEAAPFVMDWDAVERAQRELLAEHLVTWCAKYPNVEVRQVVRQDQAGHGLIEESRHAQLVVVGSRGRGGFTGLLLGSTSHALLHYSACPVVVARD